MVGSVVDFRADIPSVQVLSRLLLTERNVESDLVHSPSFAVQQGGSDVCGREGSTPRQSPPP